MGSEQSTPSHPPGSTAPTTMSPRDPLLAMSLEGSLRSPEIDRQSSVCSEAETEADQEREVPYVSYTVNQPIGGGDSPKKAQQVGGAKAASNEGASRYYHRFSSPKFRKSTMVVVKPDDDRTGSSSADPDLQRLRELPSFLPIVRASLSGHGAALKDPDILERLDYRGLLSLAQRYEDTLRACASEVATEQQDINRQVREVDAVVSGITHVLTERHKRRAKVAEGLNRAKEMSKALSKCHLLLNENIEQIEALNNMLPVEERLEPFVWTTG